MSPIVQWAVTLGLCSFVVLSGVALLVALGRGTDSLIDPLEFRRKD